MLLREKLPESLLDSLKKEVYNKARGLYFKKSSESKNLEIITSNNEISHLLPENKTKLMEIDENYGDMNFYLQNFSEKEKEEFICFVKGLAREWKENNKNFFEDPHRNLIERSINQRYVNLGFYNRLF